MADLPDKIESVHVFVHITSDGKERVILLSGKDKQSTVPLIAVTNEAVRHYHDLAKYLAKAQGIAYKVLKFTAPVDVTAETPFNWVDTSETKAKIVMGADITMKPAPKVEGTNERTG
jgi:PHD/YefM family antitoxin component YafN of YafNO toxin-antitoxin module